MDPKVFGVVTPQEATPYMVVNSVGEGGMWVSDAAGPIATGELITSSAVPGYGQKQADDVVRTYTAARAMMGCTFDETETKPVIDYRKKAPYTKITQVPVLDASGNEIQDLVPMLDAAGNPVVDLVDKKDDRGQVITETVPVLDEDSNPVLEEVVVGSEEVDVLDEAGNVVTDEVVVGTEQVPVLDEAGQPLVQEVDQVDEFGNVVTAPITTPVIDPLTGQAKRIKVPRKDPATGANLTERVVVGQSAPIPFFDEAGQPVMEQVPDGFDEVPKLDEAGNPILETVQVGEQEVPRVDPATGEPVMVPAQARDAEGNLLFSQELKLELTESFHARDPDTNQLLYTVTPRLDEDGQLQYYRFVDRQELLPERDENGEVRYAMQVVRDEDGNVVRDPRPVRDADGNEVVVDGVVVHELVDRYEMQPVMSMQDVERFEVVGDKQPVMATREVYESVPIMSSDLQQAVDKVPVYEERNVVELVPRTKTVQRSITLPIYQTRVLYHEVDEVRVEQVPVRIQVPVTEEREVVEQVPRKEFRDVVEQVPKVVTRNVQEEVPRMVLRTRTEDREEVVVEPELDAHGRYIWEIQRDEAGNEIRVSAYAMRYVDAAGGEISKEEYETRKAAGEAVHKAAFIGVVYMCG
jgi:hypothetical protein